MGRPRQVDRRNITPEIWPSAPPAVPLRRACPRCTAGPHSPCSAPALSFTQRNHRFRGRAGPPALCRCLGRGINMPDSGVLWSNLSSTVPDSAEAVLIINGYNAEGDGGQGVAFWNSSDTTAADGGTVASVTGISTGRWNRIHQGILDVRWFGAGCNGTDDTSAVQDTTAIQAAATRAAAI